MGHLLSIILIMCFALQNILVILPSGETPSEAKREDVEVSSAVKQNTVKRKLTD